jgi:hypothetical protein
MENRCKDRPGRPAASGKTCGLRGSPTAIACLLVLAAAFSAAPAAAQNPRANQLGLGANGGLHNLSANEIGAELDVARGAGARWIRFDLNWAVVQAAGRNRWNWAPFDRVIRAARARNLKVLGTIWYTPDWARPKGTPPHHPPTNPAMFRRFTGAVARRYKGLGVHHWEIWNEPNIPQAWHPWPSPRGYGRLLAAGARGLRANDRHAVVITGGLSPASNKGASIAPVTFLRGLYRAGYKRAFDAVGHHPHMFPYLPSTKAAWSPWRQMFATRPSLRSVMVRHGNRRKKIWATEYGAPTGGDRAVTQERQARILTTGYRLWAAYRWAGPLFWFSIRDRGPVSWHTTCGLVREDYAAKAAYAAYRALASAAR